MHSELPYSIPGQKYASLSPLPTPSTIHPADIWMCKADPNPEAFEKHKQDSLEKQKSGKGHWKPELASNSEESIWADRLSGEQATEEAMKRLQDQTKEAAEQTAKHGTSMSDGLANSGKGSS